MNGSARTSKPSLSERVEKVGVLARHLKSLAARSAVRRPAYRMLAARSLLYLLPGIGFALMAMGWYVAGGALIFLVPIGAIPLLFYDVGQRGRMAYHVARYARGEPSNAGGADAAVAGKRWKLVLIGVAEWLEGRLQSDGEDRGLIGGLIAGIVGEFLDVAGAFLLPAVVLDDVSLDEATARVKELKEHAPEALVASVGIDAAASMLSSFFWAPVGLIPFVAIFGLATGVLTTAQAAGVAAVLALLLAVPLAAARTLREAGKAAYFTALYLLVAHDDEVAGDRVESLEGFVRMAAPGEAAEAGVGVG